MSTALAGLIVLGGMALVAAFWYIVLWLAES